MIRPDARPFLAVVLPFLNEEETLLQTCRSLGFGAGPEGALDGAALFLVDNGSVDRSPSIAETIRDASLEGAVVIGHEPVQGYVPPRVRGNTMAEAFVSKCGIPSERVLIVQVDADTEYTGRYLAAMRTAAIASGHNVLIEARVDPPKDFTTSYPQYIELCKHLAAPFEDLFASSASDVIVDDKASAYWLSDYINWGGHQREYTSYGDEIHSETARLYMRAKATGATRSLVEEATAHPSLRKVLGEPSLHFASAGFPREKRWMQKWRSEYQGLPRIENFSVGDASLEVERAALSYQQHLIALFVVLPLHVANVLNQTPEAHLTGMAASILPRLPERTVENLVRSPGMFLTDVFDLTDSWGEGLLEEARRIAAEGPPYS